ncbi:MAG TPA: DUF1015 domain-containing protein [Myxococcota bacterium]|nr:DUF1015 domain-containing protein [Myxococcota bacterium]
MSQLGDVGLAVPEILLPATGVDLARWCVVACDQYTSQPEYWKAVEERVGAAPSTLRLVLPEAWLGASDEAARIAAIQAEMRAYLERGVFAPPRRGLVVVDRATPHVRSRLGLLAALDLERYEWRRGAQALARATEATVEERLPPRMRVRDGALVELPHVLVLIDDPERTVIEPAARAARRRAPLYDTALEPDAGRVRGFPVDGAAELEAVAAALAKLGSGAPFLYAVGDGNHSLAAAKEVWEARKRALPEAQRATDPLRWALVELVNVHDPGLRFEPIHRLVFGARAAELVAELARRAASGPARHAVRWLAGGAAGELALHGPAGSGPVAVLQTALDAWLAERPAARIDYIHGERTLAQLAAAPERVGFALPPFERAALFSSVARDGALPRKTFSLGDAEEKRFYLEARRIRAS